MIEGLIYNLFLVFMMGVMGYFLVSSPVSDTSVRAIEYQGASADETMETLKTLRGRKAVDDKLRRKDELWTVAVDKAIADQSESIVKVNEISETIRKSGQDLADLTKFAKETETLLSEQNERMNILFQMVSKISDSARESFETSNKGYEELIGEINQATVELSEASESASEVREWFEQP
ncbi:MAG: hypothetical protein CMA28_00030 [Euryarchaeota archaeon]|nr:hypothetical protein [Euryarchaeota archaeon]|tara:strand:- start:2141 stop:2677 length:537 start_codon:yes stop_codon:yes gene_type:complete